MSKSELLDFFEKRIPALNRSDENNIAFLHKRTQFEDLPLDRAASWRGGFVVSDALTAWYDHLPDVLLIDGLSVLYAPRTDFAMGRSPRASLATESPDSLTPTELASGLERILEAQFLTRSSLSVAVLSFDKFFGVAPTKRWERLSRGEEPPPIALSDLAEIGDYFAALANRRTRTGLVRLACRLLIESLESAPSALVARDHSVVLDFDNGGRSFVVWLKSTGGARYRHVPVPELSSRTSRMGEADDSLVLFSFLFGKQSARRVVEVFSRDADASMRAIVNSYSVRRSWDIFVRQFGGAVKHRLWNASLVLKLSELAPTNALFLIVAAGGDYSRRVATPSKTKDIEPPFKIDYWSRKVIVDSRKLAFFVLKSWGYDGEPPDNWAEARSVAEDLGKRELEKLKAKLSALVEKLPLLWIRADAQAFLKSDYEGGEQPLAFMFFAGLNRREATAAFNLWSKGEMDKEQTDATKEAIRTKLLQAYSRETGMRDFRDNVLAPLEVLKAGAFELNKDNAMRYLRDNLDKYQDHLWVQQWRAVRELPDEIRKRAVKVKIIRGINARKAKVLRKQISLAFAGLRSPGRGATYLDSQSARLIWTTVNTLRSHEIGFARDANRMLSPDGASLGWGYGSRGYAYDEAMSFPDQLSEYERDEVARGAAGEEERGPSPLFDDPFVIEREGLPPPFLDVSSLQDDARPPFSLLPSELFQSDREYLTSEKIWILEKGIVALRRAKVNCLSNRARPAIAGKIQKLSPLLLSDFADAAIFHDETALARLYGEANDVELDARTKVAAMQRIENLFGNIASCGRATLERFFFSVLRLGNSLSNNTRWTEGRSEAHRAALNLLLGDAAAADIFRSVTDLKASFFEKWKAMVIDYSARRGLGRYVDAAESLSARIEWLDPFSDLATVQFAFDPIPPIELEDGRLAESFRLGRAREVHPYGQGIEPDGSLTRNPKLVEEFDVEEEGDPMGLAISMDYVDGLWYVSLVWEEESADEREATLWWLLNRHSHEKTWSESDWWTRFELFVAGEDPRPEPAAASVMAFADWLTRRVKALEGAKVLRFLPIDSHLSPSVYRSLFETKELSSPQTQDEDQKLASWLLDQKVLEWDLRERREPREAPAYVEQRTGKRSAIVPRKDDNLLAFFSGEEIEETTRRWWRGRGEPGVYRMMDRREKDKEFARTSDFFFSLYGVSFSVGRLVTRTLEDDGEWREEAGLLPEIMEVKSEGMKESEVRELAEFLLEEASAGFRETQLPEILTRDPGAFSSSEREGLDSYLDVYVPPLWVASEGPLVERPTDVFVRWREAAVANPKRFAHLVEKRLGQRPTDEGILPADAESMARLAGTIEVPFESEKIEFELSAAASMESFVEWHPWGLEREWVFEEPLPKEVHASAFSKEDRKKKNRATYSWGAAEYFARKNKISRRENLDPQNRETFFSISEWIEKIFPVKEEWRQYVHDAASGIHGRVMDAVPAVYTDKEVKTRIELELALSDTFAEFERTFDKKKEEFSTDERNEVVGATRDRMLGFWNVRPRENREERILRWRVDAILNELQRELYFRGDENERADVYSFHAPSLFEWINAFFNAFFVGYSLFVMGRADNVPPRSHLMPQSVPTTKYRNVANAIDSVEIVGTISDYIGELEPNAEDANEEHVKARVIMKQAARKAQVDFDVISLSISAEGGIVPLGIEIFRGREEREDGVNFSLLRVAWRKGDRVGWHYEPLMGLTEYPE